MAGGRVEKSVRGIRRRAFQLREKGFTYALIEKQLGIPYAEAKLLGQEYDAQHGKPRKIIRTQPRARATSGPIKIPVRELRNDSGGILRQVEAGRTFVITIGGREIAELSPLVSRPTFVATPVIESIIREVALDEHFRDDVRGALRQRVDEL
jgi:antitoxin (DNA-binding transcriptional repressor) of toxin-antitoxin stability system